MLTILEIYLFGGLLIETIVSTLIFKNRDKTRIAITPF